MMAELIKGFVVNFGLSKNAKDHDFLSGLHDKKNQNKSSIVNLQICDLTIFESRILNLLLHKENIVIAQFKNLATVQMFFRLYYCKFTSHISGVQHVYKDRIVLLHKLLE